MASESSAARIAHDYALIREIQGGNASALTELLRTYGDWLARSAVTIVGSSDLAQDVVQEVFVWLWESRRKVTISGAVSAYLYRAVRNRAQNVAQRERSQRNLEARTHAEYGYREPSVANAGETSIGNEEFLAALATSLQALQPRTREIFLMRAQEGLSYAEIAEALGIGVPTVHMQMYRATKILAERLSIWDTSAGDG